jgi:putative peptide zinc metalloprotease protein
MSGGLGSQWFRVAELTPRLRAHAQIHRHVARGQVWYVVQDHQTGRFFRISPAANLMLCLMDGQRSIETIFRRVSARLGAERPTQQDVVRLLIQLHQADLLRNGLPPDMAEMDRRADKAGAQTWRSRFANPMAMRFPLVDPDRFLTATMPLLRPIFSRWGFAAWLALVLSGIVLAVPHWPEITANVSDRVFTRYNVLLLLVLYPVSKLLHELGHGYMSKANGGDVHEAGIMLLVMLPVPYVDATSSSAFADGWRRILVAAGGIMVELALAAVAMIAWIHMDPGLWRAAAFNLMLLCSVSTLLFNGNPLLRFDGYYILSDMLRIHNLDMRSRRYLTWLIQYHAFGMTRAESPVRTPSEAKWLIAYGLVSFLYRIGIMLGIGLLVAQRYFVIGVVLAMLSMAQMLLWPVLKGLNYLVNDPALRDHRRRAAGVTLGVAAVAAVALLAVPAPYAAVAQGVVWVPDEAIVRAGGDGFVAGLLTAPDTVVKPGQKLIALHDPVAQTEVEVYRARVAVARDRFDQVNLIDRVQARLALEELTRANAVLERAEGRAADLVMVAPRGGRFVVPDAAALPGGFVHKGDVLAYVIGGDDVAVRAVVPQSEIDLVRHRTDAVALRFTEDAGRSVPAEIVREFPSALEKPPAPALAPEGGGPMLLDPSSKTHDRPLDRWYELMVRPVSGAPLERIGAHAFVRFDLGAEPIAWRLLRGLRLVLLRVFDV